MHKPRQEASAREWSRIIWLDAEIRSGRYPNRQALENQFEIRRRTALNTVRFLRQSLGAPLQYSRARGGYEYTDPTWVLPAVFLQEGELLALLLAQQVAGQYLGTPLEPPLHDAIEKICRYLPDDVRVELQSVADAFQFSGSAGLSIPLLLVTDLRQAIREHRLVRMLYYTASRNETLARDIEPHFLRNVRGDWMVVAWDHRRNEPREFMLARIREYQLLDARFTPRPDLNPLEYAAHTFQTEHGAKPYAVALRFDSYQARWIRERTWHPSQQVEEQPDGGLTLHLQVAGEGDLLRWILGYGSHVEVLEPGWLRERVAEEAEATARTHGTSGPHRRGGS